MPTQAASKVYLAPGGTEGSRVRYDREDRNGPVDRAETAEYLAGLLPELAQIADRAGMDLTSYLLRMAQRDVQDALSEDR